MLKNLFASCTVVICVLAQGCSAIESNHHVRTCEYVHAPESCFRSTEKLTHDAQRQTAREVKQQALELVFWAGAIAAIPQHPAIDENYRPLATEAFWRCLSGERLALYRNMLFRGLPVQRLEEIYWSRVRWAVKVFASNPDIPDLNEKAEFLDYLAQTLPYVQHQPLQKLFAEEAKTTLSERRWCLDIPLVFLEIEGNVFDPTEIRQDLLYRSFAQSYQRTQTTRQFFLSRQSSMRRDKDDTAD